jgi:hypothetical protein
MNEKRTQIVTVTIRERKVITNSFLFYQRLTKVTVRGERVKEMVM